MDIPAKYKPILLEALEDLMYRVSPDLDKMKGQPLSEERRYLTQRQRDIEDLQHLISMTN